MGLLTKLQGGLWESQAIKGHLQPGEEVITSLAGEIVGRVRDNNGVVFLTNKRVIFLTKNIVTRDDLISWEIPTVNVESKGIARMAVLQVYGPEGSVSLKTGMAMQGKQFAQALADQKAKM